jgi:hydroxymethylbilane synthase
MTKEEINIGTRSSKLALWQARQVQEALTGVYPQVSVNIIPVKTKGDDVLDVALSKIGDKGLFTREIEDALLKGQIDIAVHSLKDMPTILPPGLTLGGVLPRGEVRDVLVSRDKCKLKDMNRGERVGTSSLRRQAQILHYNPALKVVDIRGNVTTRLRKMHEGHCDALVMAGAGFIRLGLESEITEYLDTDIMLPAVSQGAVAMEIRDHDAKVAQMVSEINDHATLLTTSAERRFLHTIEGGCQVPVGCFSEIRGHKIRLTGLIASVDGCTVLKETMEGEQENAGIIAEELARKILAMGGKEILNNLR